MFLASNRRILSSLKGWRLIPSAGMASDSKALKVIHDEVNEEFYIKLGNDKAFLQYEFIDSKKKKVDLLHTVVPEAFRGQGVAKVLAKTAFDHFVGNSQQMKLTCWYLKKFYQENSQQYQDQVIP